MGDNEKSLAIFNALTDRVIAFQPIFVDLTGSVTSALLMSQLVYWSRKKDHEEFYKKDKEIVEETKLTEKELRLAKKVIRRFFDIKLKGVPPTTFYKIKLDVILAEIANFAQRAKLNAPKGRNQMRPKGENIYSNKITTEITTDISAPVTPARVKAKKKNLRDQVDQKALGRVLDAFKDINPDYKSFFENTTQREAAAWLILTYGEEEAIKRVLFLSKNNTTKFAHKAISPKQYRDRMGEIEAFWQQKKQEKAAALTAGRTADGKKIIATPSGWVEKETSKPITGEPEVISEEEYNRRRNKLWAEAVKACGQCTDGYINLPDNTMALCHCVVDLKK
jgi:hypothetical protein